MTAWAAMHSIGTDEKYKLSFRNISDDKIDERKLQTLKKKEEERVEMDQKAQEILRFVFSRRYANVIVGLYLLSIALALIIDRS